MLLANFTYVIIAIFFIYRLVFNGGQITIPSELVIWPWVIFGIHLYLHHFFDGVQNTCRNIARIHLMDNHGLNYEQKRFQQLWELLIPNNLFIGTILWQVTHVASFIAITIYQGWLLALLSEVIIWIIPTYLPINYQKHLQRVQAHLKLTETTWIELMKNEFVPFPLISLVEHAIDEKLDPQKWWNDKFDELVSKESEIKKS